MKTPLEAGWESNLPKKCANEIRLFKKKVYGRTLYYPANDTALLFAHLLKKHTLSEEDLRCIKKLQFIEVVIAVREGNE